MGKASSRAVLAGAAAVAVVLSAPFAAMACDEHGGAHDGRNGTAQDGGSRNGTAQGRNGDSPGRNGTAQDGGSRNGGSEEEPDSYSDGVSQSDSSLKAGPKGASNGAD
ncbi:hypothetical protein GCM10010466_20800 [Planomonospora alba]|uniref:Uncharacterized protein n=1 Tax=Planomonospora alba TaxID=161354 RepID=A0ABP6MZD5_9ACTN